LLISQIFEVQGCKYLGPLGFKSTNTIKRLYLFSLLCLLHYLSAWIPCGQWINLKIKSFSGAMAFIGGVNYFVCLAHTHTLLEHFKYFYLVGKNPCFTLLYANTSRRKKILDELKKELHLNSKLFSAVENICCTFIPHLESH